MPVALALLATGGLVQAADSVRVGSKIDTEGSLLGNIIVQVLEANGIRRPPTSCSSAPPRCCAAPSRPGEIDIHPGIHRQRRVFLLR